jgi:hypothetical protein
MRLIAFIQSMQQTPPVSLDQQWSTDQALAILAVDNIYLSLYGILLMRSMDQGILSYEQAIAAILARAKKYTNHSV